MVNEPRLSSTCSAEIWGVWNSSIACFVSGAQRSAAGGGAGRRVSVLLRVELDDELLLDRRVDLRTLGVAQHLRRKSVVIGLEPCGYRGHEVRCGPDGLLGRRGGLDGDDVVRPDLGARHVHAPAIHGPMTVQDELARLAPGGSEAEANEHVVEPRLQQPQKILAGDTGLAARLLVVVGELPLEHAVVAAGLLLFAQLGPVLGLLLAATAVVARRVGASLDAALVGEAALALEEELHALAPALLALSSTIASHLDPPPLARAAAVVGLRRNVADARDLEAGGLERADRGLAAGAGALDEDLHALEALLDALAGGGVRGDLRGERRRLARALEARPAGRLPRDHVALAVAEGHDRVVEARLDVGLADGDVLPRLAATTAAACWA